MTRVGWNQSIRVPARENDFPVQGIDVLFSAGEFFERFGPYEYVNAFGVLGSPPYVISGYDPMLEGAPDINPFYGKPASIIWMARSTGFPFVPSFLQQRNQATGATMQMYSSYFGGPGPGSTLIWAVLNGIPSENALKIEVSASGSVRLSDNDSPPARINPPRYLGWGAAVSQGGNGTVLSPYEPPYLRSAAGVNPGPDCNGIYAAGVEGGLSHQFKYGFEWQPDRSVFLPDGVENSWPMYQLGSLFDGPLRFVLTGPNSNLTPNVSGTLRNNVVIDGEPAANELLLKCTDGEFNATVAWSARNIDFPVVPAAPFAAFWTALRKTREFP